MTPNNQAAVLSEATVLAGKKTNILLSRLSELPWQLYPSGNPQGVMPVIYISGLIKRHLKESHHTCFPHIYSPCYPSSYLILFPVLWGSTSIPVTHNDLHPSFLHAFFEPMPSMNCSCPSSISWKSPPLMFDNGHTQQASSSAPVPLRCVLNCTPLVTALTSPSSFKLNLFLSQHPLTPNFGWKPCNRITSVSFVWLRKTLI